MIGVILSVELVPLQRSAKQPVKFMPSFTNPLPRCERMLFGVFGLGWFHGKIQAGVVQGEL